MHLTHKHHALIFISLLCLTPFIAVAWSPVAAVTNPSAPADISIGTQVIAANPERFGANLEIFDYIAWNTNATTFNIYSGDPGMEPIVLRYKGTATGGGANTIENNITPTTSVYNTIGDGFFDGAEVRVYRVVSGTMQLLRTNTVAQYGATITSSYRITLDANGPPVQAGDIYVLSLNPDDAPLDKLNPRMAFLIPQDTWAIYPQWNMTPVVKLRDASTVAPENGGRTSMKVTISTTMQGGIFQFNSANPDSGVFNAYVPGRTYTVELWLKQQGVASGQVRFWMNVYSPTISHIFTVTNQWAKYTWSFTGPNPPPAAAGTASINITFNGPGTIWVDNVRIYDASAPPYAIRPEVIQAFQDFNPGVLRTWGGQTNQAWGTTLDNWLTPEGNQMRYWQPNNGRVMGKLFSLPTALNFAKQTGATPWLVVSPSFSESEWLNLIEYLAGPSTSPYGIKRAASGHPAPWTDDFARIRIEFGNETWNGLYQPWTFASGTQYGQFAEYFFNVAKSSPYYSAVASQIDFVLGGFFSTPGLYGYGATARAASSSASLVGVAQYLDGWDNAQIPSTSDDQRFQNVLLYTPWVMEYTLNQHVATHNTLAAQGYTYTLASYEGGPGYTLPAPGTPYSPTEEMFGKSLAAGLATLDTYLNASAHGFGPQAYYIFQPGVNWASHTAYNNGYRPHPSWLALQMRNRYAQGDMISTTINSGPTVDLPALYNRFGQMIVPTQTNRSLIGAYTFRQRAQYSIFVLSRQLTVTTATTLHLPSTPSNLTTLYKLTGDPRASNITTTNITIQQETINNFAQDYSFNMPPGSVYLFVAGPAQPAVYLPLLIR